MGYIYKIENKLNGKVYIGQTVKTVEKRFNQHKNNSNKEYFSQIVLYKAFNKYGIENFECVELEEIDNELLDEREKYWIEYYDSYFDGYNSTLGGRATQLYNWDVDDIIEKYQELRSAREVAKVIGCDHSTIDNLLNCYGVKRFDKKDQFHRPVKLVKGEEEHIFFNTLDAAKWLISNNYSRTKNETSVRRKVAYAIKDGTEYLGFSIFEI